MFSATWIHEVCATRTPTITIIRMRGILAMVWCLSGHISSSFLLTRSTLTKCCRIKIAPTQRISSFYSSSPPETKTTQYTIDCPPTSPETLQNVVQKHVTKLDRFLDAKCIAPHTQDAFDSLIQQIPPEQLSSIILDSGCGTGRSSLLLGKKFPDSTIVGVDRSVFRLSKNSNYERGNAEEETVTVQRAAPNVWLVRAELVDFWRCICNYTPPDVVDDDEPFSLVDRIDRHYVLYPNPYPKPKRLKQRFYAHPGFPLLLQLGGGCLTLRSNWETFLQEFAFSVQYADESLRSKQSSSANYARPYLESARSGPVRMQLSSTVQPAEAWTNFEQKYIETGETVYELVLQRSPSVKVSS